MWGLVLCLCSGAATGAALGYNSMVIASLNILPQYRDYFQLNVTTIGLNTAAAWIGNILSCFFTQYLCDKYGRKLGVVFGNLIGFIGLAILSAAQNDAMFVVGRIVSGFGCQFSNICATTLLAETVPRYIRGFGLGLCFCGFLIGAFISACITYGSSSITSTWAWRIPCIMQAAPMILSTCIIIFELESPRWLISKDRISEARQALARVYTNPDLLDLEMERISATILCQENQSNQAFHLEIFKGTPNLHRLILILSLGLMAELAGSGISSYYLGMTLSLVGINSPRNQFQVLICMGAWSVVTSILGSATCERFGRKSQTFWAMVCMTSLLLVLGALIMHYGSQQEGILAGRWASIVIMFIFQGAVCYGLLPMISVYPAEIYPFETRASGTAMFRFFNCGFGLLSAFVLPIGMEHLGFRFYFLNAGYNVFFLLIIYFFWVETRGKSLEEIAELFGDKIKVIGYSVGSNDSSILRIPASTCSVETAIADLKT